jgi:hypothetical protein
MANKTKEKDTGKEVEESQEAGDEQAALKGQRVHLSAVDTGVLPDGKPVGHRGNTAQRRELLAAVLTGHGDHSDPERLLKSAIALVDMAEDALNKKKEE